MRSKWWTLVAVCTGMLMLLLDITIVNIALPDLSEGLDASFSDLQWVIDSYALSLAALVLIAGSLGDLFGHRLTFVSGLAVFTLASALCGVADDPGFLIAARALQGIGGAAMFATSLALLGRQFQGRQRGIALAAWGATAGASVAFGPLVGGLITEYADWRWIFYANLPVGVLAIAILLWAVPETGRRAGVRLDWLGAITMSGAMFGLVYGLIRGGHESWGDTWVVTSFVTAGVLLVAFILTELTVAQPMLDLRLFRIPSFVGASVAAFAVMAGLLGMFLYLTLYLQNILDHSAMETGLRFLPMTLFVMVMAPIAGRRANPHTAKPMLFVGMLLVGGGLAWMTAVDADSEWTALLPGLIMAGIGSGLVNPVLGMISITTVPREQSGIGSGFNNTARQVGVAAGIAALGAVFQARVQDAFESRLPGAAPQLADRAPQLADEFSSGGQAEVLASVPPESRAAVGEVGRTAFVSGFDDVLWTGSLICLAGAVLAVLLVRRKDFVKEPDGATGEEQLVAVA